MDHLLINALLEDFTAPVLHFVLIGLWIAGLLAMRFLAPKWSTRLLWGGTVVIVLLAVDSVLSHTIPEMGELREESRIVVEHRSADVLRARRDPIFILLHGYREATSRHPLMIMDDPDGEAEQWARYYVYPKRVVSVDLATLQRTLLIDSSSPRYILSRGAPALPADVQVDIAERHDEWLLFYVQAR